MNPLALFPRRGHHGRLHLLHFAGACGLALLVTLAACSGSRPSVEVEGVPPWLPVYPDSRVQPMFETPTQEGGVRGAVSFQIPAEAGEVVAFYRDRFEAARLQVRVHPFRSETGRGARLEGGDAETGFHAIVSEEDDGTTSAIFNYTAKR